MSRTSVRNVAALSPDRLESRKAEIILELLQSVENDGGQTQRGRARELGIALGLLNFYLRHCVSKGLLRVSKVPMRRYAYYVTPRGFIEKSQLTVAYLSTSFKLFRQARVEFREIFGEARTRGLTRCALAGHSELAEIALLCAIEADVSIVAVVDPLKRAKKMIDAPVVASFRDLTSKADAIVLTDVSASQETWDLCVQRFGPARAFAPKMLGVAIPKRADK